jgi:anaerobic magnesium-protoporphyrin IX monomethyl ester cyclase
MLSVLVAHSYFQRFDQKQFDRAKPYPPLATLQVASTLRRSGHRVAVFDAMLAEGVESFEVQLRGLQPQLMLLYEDTFNFLSKMCLGRMREAGCRMIAASRRAGARVIVAGPDASDTPQAYLAAGAEMVLIGEGLAALRILIDRLTVDPHAAVAALSDGLMGVATEWCPSAHAQSGHALLPASNGPPFPAWDLIDLERYRAIWQQARGYFSLNMAASRGCSFRCNWCAKPIWGNHYLQREPSDVAAEMAYLRRSFKPDHIWFADDIFGFRVDWVTRFAAAVADEGGAIPFTIQSRADLLSDAMAAALARAGCNEVWIGAESGSQRILDSMNKGVTVQQIVQARLRLRRHGIRTGFFIQLGYLDEQLEDILATRDLLADAQPDDVGVSVSYPLPGTKFYDLVKSQLKAKTHWQQSNDLDMMFHGTYDTRFYHAVRDLLHAQIDAQRDPAAMHPLQRRWEILLASEQHHRNTPARHSPLTLGSVHGI